MINIAISTISWVRSKEEEEIVFQTLSKLDKLALPIVLVDKNSPSTFVDRVKKLSNIVFYQTTGDLDQQLLLSQKEAARLAPTLFYVQSDKLNFVKDYASALLQYYISHHKNGFLIPARTKESRDTYPHYQKRHEDFLNFFIGDYIGLENDYFAGPKFFPSKLVTYTAQLKVEIGWGLESFYYVLGKRLGMNFDFLPCYFEAPKDIGNEEEIRSYRLQITKWQIEGLMEAEKIIL